jgi:AcrR family transcriptional regulator
MKTDNSRRYGGVSQEERIAARREKLIEAAERLIERQGPASAAVTAICAEAGLTARYFYESFPNREALLNVVFERVSARLIEDLTEERDAPDPVGAVLERFLMILQAHPHLTKMFLVDLDAQDSETRRTGRALAARLVEMVAPGIPSPLARAGIAGAIFRSARAWIEGGAVEPIAEVAALARRFVEAGAR